MGLHNISTEVRNTAIEIQDFLWVGKSEKSEPREHTVEEYREFLEHIRKSHWDAWDNIADEYGWR